MFDSIAKQYDKTNAIQSFCLHKYWNRAFVDKAIVPTKPEVLLDLCCGTGAIAFEYLKKVQKPMKIYLLDFSEGMLECAKSYAKNQNLDQHQLRFLQADAKTIPLLNNSVDCATVAYGIRNIKDHHLCIKDVYRVLKPGGSFGILELTTPTHPFLKYAHNLYLKHFLPTIGKMATSNREAYQYLCNSIQSFIPPEQLKNEMREVGFYGIRQHSLLGGIATIIIGMKTI